MKEKMHLKKKDWVLIAIIIVVAGLAFFLHNLLGAKGANCVVVKVDGKIEGTYSLGEDQMKEADCPDQLCVNQKAISKNNESIICLPNKVVVEVESSENSEFDAVSN